MRDKVIIRACTVSMSVGFFIGLIPELKDMGYEVVTVSSDGPELSQVREAGGRPMVVEMERQISPFKDLVSLFKMIRIFRHEKPSMVHSMTPKAGLICMMAGMLTHVPVRVHTFTGLVFPTSTGLKKRILMLTDMLTCACATHIIPEGEGVKNDLVNNGITKKDIKVLGYGNCRGVDIVRFNPENPEFAEEAKKLRKDGVFTFIFIGRIVKDKGINELVEAFCRLYESRNIRLILVGPSEDSLDPIFDSTKEKIRNCTGIEAVGIQQDVRPWLAASDALVFPSYREGFPNVVIEAGAMGLPSIVTDVNGSREIIIEGENGIIIPPGDADTLYEAMNRMFEDKTAREYMRSNARRLVVTRYEQSFVRGCLKEFYNEILHA